MFKKLIIGGQRVELTKLDQWLRLTVVPVNSRASEDACHRPIHLVSSCRWQTCMCQYHAAFHFSSHLRICGRRANRNYLALPSCRQRRILRSVFHQATWTRRSPPFYYWPTVHHTACRRPNYTFLFLVCYFRRTRLGMCFRRPRWTCLRRVSFLARINHCSERRLAMSLGRLHAACPLPNILHTWHRPSDSKYRSHAPCHPTINRRRRRHLRGSAFLYHLPYCLSTSLHT